MNKKENNEQYFINNFSSNGEYEDIVSSSSKMNNSYEDVFSSSSTKVRKRYKKKKHGFWGAISKWWSKRKGWQKSIIVTALSLLLILSILIGVVSIVFDYNYNRITENPEELGFENVIDKDIVNIALFGIDTRDKTSFKGNSDSIMILSLNTKTKQVKIISVMRDTLVPITYNGKTVYSKINSAYSRGGPELAIKTLNTIFKLDISEYATVNFYGMADIIDAVGGIDAELTKAEVAKYDGTQHSINGCIYEVCNNLGLNPKDYYIFNSGVQHLNGIQAVAYSRIRYVANIWGTNNDYGRTDRQRYVMEQLFNKAITLGKSQYVKLAKSLIPCSETSLDVSEILGLAFDILLDSPTFTQARIPLQEFQMKQPNGVGSVVYFDLDYASKLIHALIYEDISFEDYMAANGVEKNDWYTKKVGASAQRPSDTSSEEEPVTSDNESDISDTSDVESSSSDTGSDSSDGQDDTSSDSQSSDTSEDSSTSSSGDEDTDGEEDNTSSESKPQDPPENSEPDSSENENQ